MIETTTKYGGRFYNMSEKLLNGQWNICLLWKDCLTIEPITATFLIWLGNESKCYFSIKV